jgi:NADH:ubiquinone oxidoreductase subunit 6 (subunit J)
VGAILGIVAFVVGMVTQMNSATREERVLTVAGIIAAFVGLALGIAHGGFY